MKKIVLAAGFLLVANLGFSQSLKLPYSTGFDSTADRKGWKEYRLGKTTGPKWGYNNAQSCSAPACLYHDYNFSGGATDTLKDWFVSPPLKITGEAELSFSIIPTVFGTRVEVWYGTGKQDPKVGNFTKIGQYEIPQGQSGNCLDTAITITQAADSGYIAFRYVGSNSNSYGIDNVKVISTGTAGVLVEQQLSGIVQLFPNPATNTVTINLNDQNLNGWILELRDLTGRLLLQQQEEEGRVLDIQGLSKGIYIVSVSTEKGLIATQKLFKE